MTADETATDRVTQPDGDAMATNQAASRGRGQVPEPGVAAWWKIAWYPIAVPLAFTILIWSAAEIHPALLLRPVIVTTAAVLLLTFALWALLRDRDRGALATTAVVVALVTNDVRLTAVLLFLSWLIVAEGIMNWRRQWGHGPVITRWLSVTGAALIAVTIAGAIQSGSFGYAIEDIRSELDRPRHALDFDPQLPNIYVVLLDGHPGDDGAALDRDFDADHFPAELEARAFDVQPHSRSNYLLTRLTIATMLAGDHIVASEALKPPYRSIADDSRRLRRFGDQGPILGILAAAGYETLVIASDASHLGLRQVDRVVDAPGIGEFEGALLRASGLGPLIDRFFRHQFLDLRRSSVFSAFENAQPAEAGGRPLFQWIHVMAPHPPLALDRNGAPVNDMAALMWEQPNISKAGREQRIQRTFDYVEFVDRQALALVDRLIAGDPEGVVIVMSDHGTDTLFDPTNPMASDLNERTSIILAIRAPSRPHLFPAGTTPINVLPRVLNAYLGTTLPIRSDSLWAWPAGGSILEALPIDPRALAP